VDQQLRDVFDNLLDKVLSSLPASLLKLLDEVPLHVEDYPSDEVLEMFGLKHRDALCGLHSGAPLVQRREMGARSGWSDPNVITIYREGVLRQAYEIAGRLSEKELLRQIRITVLHEMGHYHGLDEDDLTELGYG